MHALVLSQPISIADIAARLHGRPARPLTVGITGSVAVGKTHFADALAAALAPDVAVLSTDGFLFANAILADRGLVLRKGFPESYEIGIQSDRNR